MPRISTQEFERLPLRVHHFLAGVPLHDVWAVDLPRVRSGITLDEFVRTANALACTPSPIVSALVKIRLLIGQLLCWDREPAASAWEPFESRMTAADHSQSLVPAGTPDGLFRVVYRFENEQLLELINRTAHAAALSALVETANSYRFYFGVYVRRVSRFTPIYMALIDPVRKLVVYPSLLRTVRYQIDGEDAVFAEFEGQALVTANGRHYHQNYVVYLRADKGKIVFAREYFDATRVVAAFS